MGDICKILIQNGCSFITHSPTISTFYKKAFFTDQYGNTKEKISFSDFLNYYKSAGYEFPKEAIETEAEKFYRHPTIL